MLLAEAVGTVGAVIELRGFDRHPPYLRAIDGAGGPELACSWVRHRIADPGLLEAGRPRADYASVRHDGRYTLYLAGETYWFTWRGRFTAGQITRMLAALVDDCDEWDPPDDD